MAASSTILTYLSEGTHAARPAAPNLFSPGGLALYYETDTGGLFLYDLNGAAWVQIALLGVAQTLTANLTFSGAQALEPYSYNTPTTGATITMAAYERRCIVNPAGTLAALTVHLPPSPVDKQVAGVASSQIITALTVASGTGGASLVGLPSSLAAGGAFTALYRSASTTWYISA